MLPARAARWTMAGVRIAARIATEGEGRAGGHRPDAGRELDGRELDGREAADRPPVVMGDRPGAGPGRANQVGRPGPSEIDRRLAGRRPAAA